MPSDVGATWIARSHVLIGHFAGLLGAVAIVMWGRFEHNVPPITLAVFALYFWRVAHHARCARETQERVELAHAVCDARDEVLIAIELVERRFRAAS